MVPIGSSDLLVSRLGLGGSSLGGMYRESSDVEAENVIEKLLQLGLNYIDTAPYYGSGNSEDRIGRVLAGIDRKSFVISTKVSELILEDQQLKRRSIFAGKNRNVVRDYSRDGTLRSIEGSLERLKIDYIDIVYIHDTYEPFVKQAIEETLPTLIELKSQNVIKALGVGMGDCDIFIRFAEEAEFDCFLLWGKYSLLNQEAFAALLPLCKEKNISIVLGAPYESGILASDLTSGTAVNYRYHQAPPDVLTRAKKIEAICRRHNVPLKAAAMQFIFGHPAVTTVIPGTRSPERLAENSMMMQVPIPPELWSDLKSDSLLPEAVPVPPTAALVKEE